MESAGYAVESFGSAEEFLASASAQNAACLILDVQLPGINGLELQDKLIEPIIVCRLYSSPRKELRRIETKR